MASCSRRPSSSRWRPPSRHPGPGRGDERYGLGLQTFTLSCGGTAWSHGGDYPGYSTTNAVSTDGRAVTLATTALPTSLNVLKDLENFVDAAMCE
jgi:D-alanyl-D-alanine carboxypeptidase